MGRQILHVDESGVDRAGAAEAHRLGMQVLGHVPATMRPLDAVKAGYDEITHINFVAMQAMPDEVVNKANTAQRIEGPAKYFKDVDLNGPQMKNFIDELAKRKTVDRSDARGMGGDDDFGRRRAGRRLCVRTWASSRPPSTASSSRPAIRWSRATPATIIARATPRWSSWSARCTRRA